MSIPMHGIKMVYIHLITQSAVIFIEFLIDFTFLFPFLFSSAFEISVQQLQLHPHALNSCNKQINIMLLPPKPNLVLPEIFHD